MTSRPYSAIALLLALVPSACSLTNDLSGYAGGRAADSAVSDTTPTDTTVTPMDTGEPDEDSSTGNDATTEAGIDGTVADTRDAASESGVDGAAVDTKVDIGVATDTSITADTSTIADTFDSAVAKDTSFDAAWLPCHVVINEVQTGGTASAADELIELYNQCDVPIPIAGWKLSYRSESGATELNVVASIAAGTTIAAKGFLVFATVGGTHAAAADGTFTQGLAAAAGGVGLRDTSSALVDSVTWGTAAATHIFTEGAPSLAPSAGSSISRVPNGKDTNDNSADFQKTTTTPKS